jgi:hypothetical protein
MLLSSSRKPSECHTACSRPHISAMQDCRVGIALNAMAMCRYALHSFLWSNTSVCVCLCWFVYLQAQVCRHELQAQVPLLTPADGPLRKSPPAARGHRRCRLRQHITNLEHIGQHQEHGQCYQSSLLVPFLNLCDIWPLLCVLVNAHAAVVAR